MSSKQDVTSPRTATDLERKYNFGRSFAEVMGVATNARNSAQKAEKIALSVQQKMMDIDIVEELNLSVGKTINIKTNGLTISSEDFSLSAENGIIANLGRIADWDISSKAISKITDSYYVKIAAPTTADSDFISVFDRVNENNPLRLKADGSISATKGDIGGWTIQNDSVSKGLYYYDFDNFRGTGFQPPNSGTWAISVGYTDQSNWSTGVFRVKHTGETHCKQLYLDQTFSFKGSNGVSVSGNNLHSLLTQICSAISSLNEQVFMSGGLPLSITEESTNEQTT